MSALTTLDTSLAPIPFGRDISIETRKMFDTRGGLWLFIITGGLLALVLGIMLLVLALEDGATITAAGFAESMTIPLSLLMPVFAILCVTSEWSQRTHLTSFTIQPSRLRLLAAKFIAVTVLALGTLLVAILFGVIGNLAYGAITGNEVVWNVPLGDLAWNVGLQLCFFWMAFAIGTLLLNTPAAIAVFYVVGLFLPFMVYPPVSVFFDWAREIVMWIDFNYASMPLMAGTDFFGEPVTVGALDYLRFAFTIFLWIVLPLTLGIMRLRKTEIK